MDPVRLGVLDVGSNTVHLLVVDAHRGGHPTPMSSTKSPLRLAEAIDGDGEVHCSQCDDTEVVSDSWGRSITRIKPPEEPETDPEGEYACYWDTCGTDAHVVARYSTRAKAEQAVAAKDWPGPRDSTNYLCGYVVRELVDGEWVCPLE